MVVQAQFFARPASRATIARSERRATLRRGAAHSPEKSLKRIGPRALALL